MSHSDDLKNFLSKKTKELLDFIYDGVYVVDKNRKIHFWNKGAVAITGFSKKEVMGKCCRDDILNHIDADGVLLCTAECPLAKAIKSDIKIEEKVFPLHKDKHRFPTSTHISPIKNDKEEIIGAIEVFRDTSSEEKLRIVQEKFQKLIKQYVSEATFETVLESIDKDAPVLAASKELSIFFMDIVGFTTISETHSAKDVVNILNSYFTLASQVVKQNTGDIDKFIGDGVMAIFIDAQDAVNTAKAILLKGLPSLNRNLKSKKLSTINVRIGINSGNLVQGDIGSGDRRDMTVIGDPVNIASRIENVSEPGNFMISESTLARIENKDEFEFSEEMMLKGKSELVKLYRFKK